MLCSSHALVRSAGQKWTTRQRLIQEGHKNPVKQLQDGLWQVLEDRDLLKQQGSHEPCIHLLAVLAALHLPCRSAPHSQRWALGRGRCSSRCACAAGPM